ncbi:MAG: hypothetical protein P0Y55_01185 [Candidatus Cohnella colombiensis]|uniref:Uncharacterized protein n=1 Tax=Candidatus Cohnella colombiensis TaxID=3121368 RepID=A0AA95EXS2_9BACL|nr:MAG: hypothetical protein P0Y55_01185 [Cohnella sp.]
MQAYFSICATASSQQKYIDFLLSHYNSLNLPYSFPVALSYISSPVLMYRESILIYDEDDEIAGAIGYIHGTGENNYSDIHIVQVQIIYLLPKYRKTSLFVHSVQFLTQHLLQIETTVTELRFWSLESSLWNKLGTATHVQDIPQGKLVHYSTPLTTLHEKVHQYSHEIYY